MKQKKKKELGVFEKKWIVFKTRRYSLTVNFVRLGYLYGGVGGNFGIGVIKNKRNVFKRIGFWLDRRKFKNLTIEELRELSTIEQKKYLYLKYHLYGITPYLLRHRKDSDGCPRCGDPLNDHLRHKHK